MHYASVFKPGLFSGQVHIVTGGGSGIGRCTAHELAALGAHVALVGRKEEKLQAVAREIAEDTGSSDNCSFHVCDIREEEQVKSTVKQVLDTSGRVDGLVNNAGGQFPAPLASINQKGWETVVRTNLTGGFLMAREVYGQYMAKNGGAIVNIVADMWGGMPGMGHSGAARAGMVNLTQTAAVEWGTSGVRVNAVAPGWIASSGMDNYPPSMKSMIIGLRDGVPLKRLGNESEVSSAIVFLLSPAAAFISGTTVRIDGAASQGGRVWPLPPARNNAPFNGFHRASTPRVLQD
ncbi:SDR family oxidoreductase [Hydrocarboniclastica marina]|uniref:Peroxisomal trans-2-enoyl-CoA reductase n=1 Tax=Hydrocarboniclastica marina TaxID=2259620 RepID=A0A4P7XL24_9ALTE|nr:SDR family oxidoreductase [Hydrocarboniclastica marina]QCF26647.1 SDR family NAD(P)-dependent oxidoreductase [Hydrocarboniclastica marina]